MPVFIGRPMDWVKVAVIAYVAVKVVNLALTKAGAEQFKI